MFSTTRTSYPDPPVENTDKGGGPRHKEEGKKRREIDSNDRRRISLELARMSHPLENRSSQLYNIENGGFASLEAEVNVADSLEIGEIMTAEFRASLLNGFHSAISSPIKTMEHIKKGVRVGDTTIFDLETIFLRLLTIGQQGQMELAPIFQYELCPVPPSLIDEYGCLRKGTKAPLAHTLCTKIRQALLPDVTIVDVSQLLYHIIWPFRGNASAIIDSIKTRLISRWRQSIGL